MFYKFMNDMLFLSALGAVHFYCKKETRRRMLYLKHVSKNYKLALDNEACQ